MDTHHFEAPVSSSVVGGEMGKICKDYSVNRGWTHVRFDGESEMPSYREILSGQGRGEEAGAPGDCRRFCAQRPAPMQGWYR
jgi:hypothetical protein